jgi:hypothetical protein
MNIRPPKYNLDKCPPAKEFKIPSRNGQKRAAANEQEHNEPPPQRRARSPASAQEAQESKTKLLKKTLKTYTSRKNNEKITHVNGHGEDSEDESSRTQSTPASTASTKGFLVPPNIDVSGINSLRASSSNKPSPVTKFQNPDFEPEYSSEPKISFESPEDILSMPKELARKPPESPPKPPTERRCPFCRRKLPESFTETPPTSSRAQFGYCQRHENSSIIAIGKLNGYPTSLDFTLLKSRVIEMLPEIRQLIDSSIESEFMTKLRSKTSRRSAAAPMSMINFFEDSQPGYYGSRGSEIISQTLIRKYGDYLRGSDERFEDVKYCGGITGFISSVLVPEVGVRLIMEDMDVNWGRAKQIMKDSVSYGTAIQASVEILDIR